MDINNFQPPVSQTTKVHKETTFYVGPGMNIEVVVVLEEYNGKYYLSAWMNDDKEIETKEYKYSIKDTELVFEEMQKLVYKNESRIIGTALGWRSI